MSVKSIEKAIINYLTQEADSDDLDLLSNWIQKPENQGLFEDYVMTHYKITLAMSNPDVSEIKENLLKHIRKSQNKMRKVKVIRLMMRYTAAAAIVGVLATYYFFNWQLFHSPVKNDPIIVNNQIVPGTDKATLTLETGKTIPLEKGTVYKTNNITSNGDQIEYKKYTTTNELVYNYLTVPRGGQFVINLADGTKVWLNSESQLKYPVSFVDGESREVELTYGEAYFEVSHSTEHKGSNFKVVNNNQVMEVLGTKFNIKAYKDESTIYTTLVEGKVKVSSSEKSVLLSPNQQSIIGKNNSDILVKAVDVFPITSWKNGIFYFKGMTLKQMSKVLARWYDVEFIIEDSKLQDITFVGVLRKELSIEEILSSIVKSSQINTYEINNKTIIIK